MIKIDQLYYDPETHRLLMELADHSEVQVDLSFLFGPVEIEALPEAQIELNLDGTPIWTDESNK